MSRASIRSPLVVVFVISLGLFSQGCDAKPSEEACRDAINNIRRVTGQESSDVGADPTAAIRSCRANSSTASVDCLRTAKSVVELESCEGDVASTNFAEAENARKQQIEKSRADEEEKNTQKQPTTTPAED